MAARSKEAIVAHSASEESNFHKRRSQLYCSAIAGGVYGSSRKCLTEASAVCGFAVYVAVVVVTPYLYITFFLVAVTGSV